jgi:hypothetical protein
MYRKSLVRPSIRYHQTAAGRWPPRIEIIVPMKEEEGSAAAKPRLEL